VSLSPHARALAEQLADDGEHVALTFIPTAAAAAEHGMTVAVWTRWRQELLASVGAGIAELRRVGWDLSLEHRTRDLPDGVERIVAVEAHRIPEHDRPTAA
jgi:hypothetical protein